MVLGVFTALAQKPQLGIKAGINWANMRGVDIEEPSPKLLPYGGLYVNLELSNRFTFQPELLYSKQGVEFEKGFIGRELSLSYINIPLMFQYGITKNISIELGPQIGILLNFKYSIDYGSDGQKAKFEIESTNGRSPIDFGMNLGGIYSLENGFNVYIRYNLGLISITEGEDLYSPSDEINANQFFHIEAKHSILSLGIGYNI